MIDQGIKLLISILNESEKTTRVRVIETLEKLLPSDPKIFNVLENSLVSDESELVRFAASKALLKIFPEQCVKPIEWAINHEKSVYFFKKLLTLLETNNSKVSSDFISLVLKRVGDCYHINPIEAKFILDYTFLIYRNFIEHNDPHDKNRNRYVREMYLELNQYSGAALLSSTWIENGHIKEFSLNGKISKPRNLSMDDYTYSIREIPDSLTLLSKLKKLHISGFCLNQIPDLINKLTSLKHLSINRNYIRDYTRPKKLAPQVEKLIFGGNKKLKKTPDFLWEFANRSLSVKNYVKEGVLPSEAPVLAMLEILRGEPISNAELVMERWKIESIEELGVESEGWSYEDIDWYENHITVYTLNDKGYVNRISSENPELPSIGLFPEEICTLRHLTELTLVNQEIREIPECIGNLKKLEILNLSDNKIKELPSSVKKLTKLKCLNLGCDNIFMSSENVIEIINMKKQKNNLKIYKITEFIKEKKTEEQKQQEVSKEKIFEPSVPKTIKYPPKEILRFELEENRDFEYILLWMLFNNDYCTWLELKSDPLNIKQATLSKYLSILIQNNLTLKLAKGCYGITKAGKREFKNLKRRT
jgi:Leucine-rich repeat (LRR) protein